MGKTDSHSSMKETGVKLDSKTPLLNFEKPENSTEPQKEPWSQPEKGYKWYDRSTFKPGSYGSTQSGSDNNDNGNNHHGSDNEKVGDAQFLCQRTLNLIIRSKLR